MIVQVDVNRLVELGLTADQYVWLKMVHDNQPNTAQRLVDIAAGTKFNEYMVSLNPPVVNRSKLNALFQTNDSYFWEFYNEYPLKVPAKNGGYRVLKTMRSDTKLAKDMQKKYEAYVKPEAHSHVMRCLLADVAYRRRTNALQYMPAIEAYINGRDWEKAEYLLELKNGVQSNQSKEGYGQGLI